MKSEDLYEWLRWRLAAVVEDRRGDYAAISHGGASYEEGVRAGEERALRDVIDMVESLASE